jgi:hypothetical protein
MKTVTGTADRKTVTGTADRVKNNSGNYLPPLMLSIYFINGNSYVEIG